MTKLSISKAWDETRETLARDGKLFVPIALAFLVLPGVVAELALPSLGAGGQGSGTQPLIMLMLLLFGLTGQMAIQRLTIASEGTVGGGIALAIRRLPTVLGAVLLLVVPISLILAPFLARYIVTIATQPTAESFMVVIGVFLIVLLALARFLLILPVAVSEGGWPFTLLRRGWALGQGSTLKLYVLLLLSIVLPLVVSFAATAAVGSLIIILLGQPGAWTVSALLVALVSQLAAALVSVPFAVLFGRVYVQLAGTGAKVSVPTSGS